MLLGKHSEHHVAVIMRSVSSCCGCTPVLENWDHTITV